MTSTGSVTVHLRDLKQGDRGAAGALWERYYRRLVGLARAKLTNALGERGVNDAEDVALSAFDSFYRRAEQGRFAELDDRKNLWRLLFTITARKAISQAERTRRRPELLFGLIDESDVEADGDLYWNTVPDEEPSPEIVALLVDQCRLLYERLNDPTLISIARWKMEGYTNREIAGKLDVIEQTVERKLRRIRAIWSREPDPCQ